MSVARVYKSTVLCLVIILSGCNSVSHQVPSAIPVDLPVTEHSSQEAAINNRTEATDDSITCFLHSRIHDKERGWKIIFRLTMEDRDNVISGVYYINPENIDSVAGRYYGSRKGQVIVAKYHFMAEGDRYVEDFVLRLADKQVFVTSGDSNNETQVTLQQIACDHPDFVVDYPNFKLP